jgi:glycosyltransferase involved in cell wall biosynthesis
MVILHITNDFFLTSVYQELFLALDKIGIDQIIYVPLKTKGKHNIAKKYTFGNRSVVYLRPVLNLGAKFDLHYKARLMYDDITSLIDISSIDLIHAHTWYTCGALAFELSKRYSLPYVLAVRNSDMNVFYKYMIHFRLYAGCILRGATNIFCISAAYKKRLLNIYNENDLSSIHIIPNGINQYWWNNKCSKKVEVSDVLQFVYVGRYTDTKNVVSLMQVIIKLNLEGYMCHLSLVGGGGGNNLRVLRLVKQYPEYFREYGMLTKEQLLNLFRSCDIFTMPSKHETFGLVYIEALSQGLPVLYSMNEGIDGFYGNEIGEKCIPTSKESIKNALKMMFENFHSYTCDLQSIEKNHSWWEIARKYEKIYTTVLS